MAETLAATAPSSEQTGPAPREYVAFEKYPWQKNKPFLLGLIEALGGPDQLSPNPVHLGTCIFSRTVYYKRQTGVQVDLVKYNTFITEHPDHPSVDGFLLELLYSQKMALENSFQSQRISSRMVVEAVAALDETFDLKSRNKSSSNPSWQQSAPRQALRINDADKNNSSGSLEGGATADDAPYPGNFAKVVAALQAGKEVEGIRQIPDTIAHQPGLSAVGKLAPPKKPWERGNSPSATSPQNQYEGEFTLIDKEFPLPDRNLEGGWVLLNN